MVALQVLGVIASVLAGGAAAVALIMAIHDRKRDSDERKRDRDEREQDRKRDSEDRKRDLEEREQDRKRDSEDREKAVAKQVFAWAVRESTGDPVELRLAPKSGRTVDTLARGGVVFKNVSQDVALDVEVKTQWRKTVVGELEDDEFEGQRFAVIPPGTYYIQQRPIGSRGADESAWSAPIPLDDSSGRLAVDLRDPGEDEAREVTLLPHTSVPEDKRVALLRFKIREAQWHRNDKGTLLSGDGAHTWDEQFKQSEQAVLSGGSGKRTYNPDVANVVQQLFRYFTDDNWSRTEPLTQTQADARTQYRRIFTTVRMPGKLGRDGAPATTQTLRLRLTANAVYELSIEGSGALGKVASKVEILGPNGAKRAVVGGMTFGRLPVELASPADLNAYAEEIVAALEETLQQPGILDS